MNLGPLILIFSVSIDTDEPKSAVASCSEDFLLVRKALFISVCTLDALGAYFEHRTVAAAFQ